MPFNGGGGGSLPAHEHTNIANDGGPLDFNNTTVGSMNSGDITFSDGAALQTLAYPGVPAGETLTAQALSTAPAWVAAAPSTASYVKVAETELGVAGTSIDVPFAQIDMVDIAELVVFANLQIGVAGRSANMRVNSDVGSNYSLTGYTIGTGPSIAATSNSGTSWHLELSGSASQYQQMVANLIVNNSGDIQGIIQYAADNYPSSYTVKLNTSTTFFDNIEIITDPSGGGSFAAGSVVSVFKVVR